MMNVLIFPAGTEIGKEIYMSMRYIKDINIILAGSDYDNHARHYNEKYHIVPSVQNPDWVSELQSVIVRDNIDYVFPAHDDALLALSDNRELFTAHILCPSKKTCDITRYKSKTYQALEGLVPLPTVYPHVKNIDKWPVFVKPDRGQGALGAKLVNNIEALNFALSEDNSLIICEFLPGEEYTVDCFTDRDKGLVFCQPRLRSRIRSGIAATSELTNITGMEDYANIISDELNLHGAWFFQIKRSEDGIMKVMEVAPRIAGTMALNRVNGVNFPVLTIYEFLRVPVSIRTTFENLKITRSLVNQFSYNVHFNHVYIDYDDTIIIKNRVNTKIIAFLYDCINDGKKINLITKHKGDLDASLNKYRLSHLFDSIFHISPTDHKSDFIYHKDSIFIDDSFYEREMVSTSLQIPVFDVSMMDVFTNE